MAGVKLQNISKVYENKSRKQENNLAVDNMSFEVFDKEFLVLIGPSGCGKSTVLRMIAGLEEITSGDIFIGGKNVAKEEPKDRNVSFVFQNYALYPHMTAFNNMAFGLKLRKLSKDIINKKVMETAEMLEISHLLDRKPKALSGGERQRVALGRAIVREPELFLFDEPLSNLDAALRHKMRQELTALHKRLNTTFIYVTHDQTEALTMAERIAVMKDGRLQQIDTPANIYSNPANTFTAEFISFPPMNLIEVFVDKKEAGIFANVNGISLQIPNDLADKKKLYPYIDKSCIMGLRPENITAINKPDGNFSSFALDIGYIERIGPASYAHGCFGNTKITADVSGTPSFKANDKGLFKLDMNKACFFDLNGNAL